MPAAPNGNTKHATTDSNGTSQLAEATAILNRLIVKEKVVDRFDASYLDDLHHILREVHGVTGIDRAADASTAQKDVNRLAEIVNLENVMGIQALASELKRLGIDEKKFLPQREGLATKIKYKYVQRLSWWKARGLTANSSDDSLQKIRDLQVSYTKSFGATGEKKFTELARPVLGDPWTPLFKSLLKEGKLNANSSVMTIGPRWAGEIHYFRDEIGLKKTIGLDLYTRNPELIKAGDMHAMPFGDDVFDVVYQRSTFDKAYDIRTAIDECVRVLKDGGILISDECLDYTDGVSELARTNMKSNDWILSYLGPLAGEILVNQEAPSTSSWMGKEGQLAVRIRKNS